MSLIIYPNPNAGRFYVELNGIGRDLFTLEVFNSIGQMVYASQMNISQSKLVDLENKVPGIYIIRVSSKMKEIRQKIIIQ